MILFCEICGFPRRFPWKDKAPIFHSHDGCDDRVEAELLGLEQILREKRR